MESENKRGNSQPIRISSEDKELSVGRIKSIKAVGVREVWDIQVSGDHSYRAQGLIHHNSSKRPNLHNQPKTVRPLFIPVHGHKFIDADFAQMEIRCLAAECHDPGIMEALEKEDIHRAVAAWLFNVPYDEVTEDQRYRGKTLNFAILYQMGPDSLAEALDCTEDEAKDLISTYFKRFTEVAKWVELKKEFAQRYGFVYNMLGRVRRLPGASILSGGSQAACLRQAVNAPIQSLAADITNLAIIRAIKELPGYQNVWHFVNTVHDSVLIEVVEDRAEEYKPLVVDVLTTKPFKRFDIELEVDCEIVDRWGGELDVQKMIPEALATKDSEDE